MFKNLTFFKIHREGGLSAADLCLKLEAAQYAPIGTTQEKSIGWVPPRGHEWDPMVETVNGTRIARLIIETKSVPAATIQDAVDKTCAAIEANTGRKPGRKERRELKEEAKLAMLPNAFPRRLAVWVAIDADNGMLLIDSASDAVVDDVLTMLVKCVDGARIDSLNTEQSASTIMTCWLTDGDKLDDHDRFSFAIGRACELHAADESRAVVRYKNHPLLTDEVRNHIAQGKYPVKLALQWNDRVSFTLDTSMRLSGIAFEDVVFDGNKDTGAEQFDADVMLTMGELKPLIANLIEAMGGEAKAEGREGGVE